MKKLFLVLGLVFVSSLMMIKAQTEPVFNYTNPSLSEIKKLAGSYTEKGHEFYLYLQETINMKIAATTWRISDAEQLGLDSMFKYISSEPEEITLKEGSWLNSGYNVKEKKMKASIGHEKTKFCWMFKKEEYSFPVLIGDCANVIRSITFCAPKSFQIDVSAFDRRLNEITNSFNFLSIKVEKNTGDLAALRAEINGMKENQKTAVEQLKHYIWRTGQESERRDYLLKGGLDLLAVAVSGIGSGLLWHAAFEKHWEEEDIMREVESDYTYWQYTLEKQDYIPLPPSNGKSSKSGGSSVPTIFTPFNSNQPKPEINFNGGFMACGDGNNHGDNHDNHNPGCPDNGDVTNIYSTINNILNMIVTNQITNNFVEYVTNNIQVFQDFVNNYYTTNNYNEYVTKIEQILNTYNTYVTNNNTYITNNNTYNTYNNTYVVATYTLKGEMKTGKIKISVLDRGMVKKSNPDKGWYVAGAIALDVVAGIFIDRAIHNFQEAHNIKISLRTDLKQMYSSVGPSWNSQIVFVQTFGGRHNRRSSVR
jgi:hypothetical protein